MSLTLKFCADTMSYCDIAKVINVRFILLVFLVNNYKGNAEVILRTFTATASTKTEMWNHSSSASSAVECCALCNLNDTCIAVNWNDAIRECQVVTSPNGEITHPRWTNLKKVGVCPPRWIFDGLYSCYFINENANFTVAKDACEINNAHLIYIETMEEQEFLIPYLSQGSLYYIGGVRYLDSCTWRWLNNEEVVYTNWYPTDPNGKSMNEDRIMISGTDGKWYDFNENIEIKSICEMSLN